ncbi:hypothetical protein GCM10009559_22430 [Pseudonocardia zijingensis]|uniref:Uncharacterized protein n=1 Tax=Pseudonocardia zijingensis TaxID=153376 RepID=A0ABN1PUN9_9PSEU
MADLACPPTGAGEERAAQQDPRADPDPAGDDDRVGRPAGPPLGQRGEVGLVARADRESAQPLAQCAADVDVDPAREVRRAFQHPVRPDDPGDGHRRARDRQRRLGHDVDRE